MSDGGCTQVQTLVQHYLQGPWNIVSAHCLCDPDDPLCTRVCGCSGKHASLERFVFEFFTGQRLMRVHEQTVLWLDATTRILNDQWRSLQLTPCNICHTFLCVLLLVIKLTDDESYTQSTYRVMVAKGCGLRSSPHLLTAAEQAVFARLGFHVSLAHVRPK